MNESVTRRLFIFTLSNICLINGFQHSRSAKHCKYVFLQRFRKWLNRASFATGHVIRWDNSLSNFCWVNKDTDFPLSMHNIGVNLIFTRGIELLLTSIQGPEIHKMKALLLVVTWILRRHDKSVGITNVKMSNRLFVSFTFYKYIQLMILTTETKATIKMHNLTIPSSTKSPRYIRPWCPLARREREAHLGQGIVSAVSGYL